MSTASIDRLAILCALALRTPIMPAPFTHISQEITFDSSTELHTQIDHIHSSIGEMATDGTILIYSAEHKPPTFYVPGGDIYVMTEGIVFHFHKYFLICDSTWWPTYRDSQATGPDGEILKFVAGRSAVEPVPLPGMTAKQFASFLWVIYNPKLGTHTTTKEEWAEINKVAILLGAARVKELAEHHWNRLERKDANNEGRESRML